MTTKTLVALLVLALAVPAATGCAADASPAEASEAQEVVAGTDAALKREIAAAIVGLETGGGEGDPDPYKLVDLKLSRGESMTDDVLLARLLPKMMPTDDAEAIPGLDPEPVASAWVGVTAEPTPDDFEDVKELEAAKQTALKWRKVKQIFDAKLTNVKYFDMGYRAFPNGSLETGAVAHVFVGQSSTGRVIAIWGIDIST
jgi:hypothetical protein